MTYPWPGNVRELATVIDRAAILGDGKRLEIAKALGIAVRPTASSRARRPRPQPPQLPPAAPAGNRPLDAAMRQHIEAALTATAGRMEGPHGAARLLQINPHTLRARMRKLGIDWKQFRPAEPEASRAFTVTSIFSLAKMGLSPPGPPPPCTTKRDRSVFSAPAYTGKSSADWPKTDQSPGGADRLWRNGYRPLARLRPRRRAGFFGLPAGRLKVPRMYSASSWSTP